MPAEDPKNTRDNPHIPVALAFAINLGGKVDSDVLQRSWIGPCPGRRLWALFEDEPFEKGKCDIELCPRNTVLEAIAAKR